MFPTLSPTRAMDPPLPRVEERFQRDEIPIASGLRPACPSCNSPAPPRSRVRRIDPPTLPQLLARFTSATAAWAAAGFPVCDQQMFNQRLATCQACEDWIPNAALGFGRCARCGCLKTKLWLATERCPEKRWSPDQ